ncbi:hypothetical protein ALI144C_07330 [Actinosynnema sp. ALI-1.44]|nr:hypothetical protein ALI144C_07330 [Actinosynnema sp. ALI-1.44]
MGRRQDDSTIRQVIADVLGVESVSMSDNPFDLGLTSIQAIRICARIRHDLSLDPAPECLLGSATVAGFVATVRGRG